MLKKPLTQIFKITDNFFNYYNKQKEEFKKHGHERLSPRK